MNRYTGCALSGLALYGGMALAATVAPDCTQVLSPVNRLACFDRAAGTGVALQGVQSSPVTLPVTQVFRLLRENESQRQPGQLGFLMTTALERPATSQQRVMVSAPALGDVQRRHYLAISCISNITRLQVLSAQPLARHAVRMQLWVDGREVGSSRPWRVIDGGQVIDAGRGLPAVELIRKLDGGSRIELRSDERQIDRLVFDADGLAPLIQQEREACHW